jgi:hypothetical protein
MTANHQTLSHPSPWRLAGIVSLYALLGPLVGALAVNGVATLASVGTALAEGEPADIARRFWGGLGVGSLLSMILAYAVGIASALGVGLAVAVSAWRSGIISLRIAAVAALVCCALTIMATIPQFSPPDTARWVVALMAGHGIAVAVCTGLARRLF